MAIRGANGASGLSIGQLRNALREKMDKEGDDRYRRKLLALEWAKEHGHILLWTPPNRSVINMIEYCWRNAKAYVRQYHLNCFKPKEAAQKRRFHLHLGFYGDPTVGYFGITPENTPSLLREGLRQAIKMHEKGEGSNTSVGVLKFEKAIMLGAYPRFAMTYKFHEDVELHDLEGREGEDGREERPVSHLEREDVPVTLRNLAHFKDVIGEQWMNIINEAYNYTTGESLLSD